MWLLNGNQIKLERIFQPYCGFWHGSFISSYYNEDISSDEYVITEDETGIIFNARTLKKISTYENNLVTFGPIHNLNDKTPSIQYFNTPLSFLIISVLAGETFEPLTDTRLTSYTTLSDTKLKNINNICNNYNLSFSISPESVISLSESSLETDLDELTNNATFISQNALEMPLQKIDRSSNIYAIEYTERKTKIWI
jgi:hypothetical protein